MGSTPTSNKARALRAQLLAGYPKRWAADMMRIEKIATIALVFCLVSCAAEKRTESEKRFIPFFGFDPSSKYQMSLYSPVVTVLHQNKIETSTIHQDDHLVLRVPQDQCAKAQAVIDKFFEPEFIIEVPTMNVSEKQTAQPEAPVDAKTPRATEP